MDYDRTKVPQTYDAGREMSISDKAAALAFFVEKLTADSVRSIIDLGCGTARFSAALADVFEADVLGVDPSSKMLDQARNKFHDSRLNFALGSGELIPADDDSCDLVFMSMVLHHLSDPAQVARECYRVLRTGGSVCIRNTVLDEIGTYPYLTFFPGIESIISQQLRSRAALNAAFADAGCGLIAHETVWDQLAPDWPTYAEKVALRADSFVARLPEAEFQQGLEAMQTHARQPGGSQSVGLNIDYFIYRSEKT